MSAWIPFYASLREGDKRGLPRAVRFVYLELSLLARGKEGVLPLPRGFRSDLDALHDVLGGKRSEISEAMALLTVPMDPTDPLDMPMLTISGPQERRILTVTAHSAYVRPDKSTERVRKWRETHVEQYRQDGTCGNGDETRYETEPVTLSETPQRKERKEKRVEEREESVSRDEEHSGPPDGKSGTMRTAPRATGDNMRQANRRGTRLDPSWTVTPELVEYAKSKGVDGHAIAEEFRDHWLSSNKPEALKQDWDAAFRTWVRNGIKFGNAPVYVAPPPPPKPPRDMFAEHGVSMKTTEECREVDVGSLFAGLGKIA